MEKKIRIKVRTVVDLSWEYLKRWRMGVEMGERLNNLLAKIWLLLLQQTLLHVTGRVMEIWAPHPETCCTLVTFASLQSAKS